MADASTQVDLLDVAASPWAGAASCIAGAVLFLDAGAAAAAAGAGGAPLLFGLGALAVLDLTAAAVDAATSSGDGTQPVCLVVTLPLDVCLEEVAARVEVCLAFSSMSKPKRLTLGVVLALPQTRPDAQHVTLLCAVRESEQSRGAYGSAAGRLDKALRRRDEAGASRDGWDGDEDWDDAQEAGVSDAGHRGRVTVQNIALCLAPLGRSALTLPPGSYAAEAPLAEPGAHMHGMGARWATTDTAPPVLHPQASSRHTAACRHRVRQTTLALCLTPLLAWAPMRRRCAPWATRWE